MNRTCALLALLIACALPALAAPPTTNLVYRDDDGRWRVHPPAVPEALRNPVDEAYETAFWTRAQPCITHNTGRSKYGNTYFENEKASYPPAMFDVLFGRRAKGLEYLQAEDNQAGSWNSLTEGIDYYACFTLKHQMRKYFYLGGFLDADYFARMTRGARLWTESDPVARRNPYFKKPGEGWTPETKNAWVDGRNTDNLRAMRETSVYLMAEATGNEDVRRAYKAKIQRYVWALWNIGMGEWDSENYHMHTFAPYCNLYDFAQDTEVRTLAKAALDMLATMGAAKYYNGGFCGPIKRDYNKPYVFGGAAGELWLYFGDTPVPNPHPHGDTIHFVTSAYRPPAAVVALAQKAFDEPQEWIAAKPTYQTWEVEGGGSKGPDYPAANYPDADHQPWVFETTYIGSTFQLGTLPQGSFGDVNGFKLLMRDPERGAQFFSGASVSKPAAVNRGSGKDRIAHSGPVAIVLTAQPEAPWSFFLPEAATVEAVDGVTFVRHAETWIALHPVALQLDAPDGALPRRDWSNLQGMTGRGQDDGPSGFVMEVGDPATHETFAAFRDAVLKTRPDLSARRDGRVSYTSTTGRRLALADIENWHPTVERDGEIVQHARENWALWRPAHGAESPLSLGWKEGRLRVEAGDRVFEGIFSRDGSYTWSHR